MGVILLILRIIGITILVIIGMVLLLLLAVIFCPVRYRIKADIEDETSIYAGMRWLFYLIYIRFRMVDEKKTVVLYLCGIKKQLYPAVEKHRKENKQVKNEHLEDTLDAESMLEIENNNITSPEQQKIMEHIPESEAAAESQMNSNKKDMVTDGTDELDSSMQQRKSLRNIINKIRQMFRKIIDFLKLLPEKIKQIYTKIVVWKEMLTDKGNQAAVKLVFREIKELLSHYRPRGIRADIRYGFEDPSATGKSLAIISMIPFLHRKKVQIIPVFETEQFFIRGNLDGRGHIRLFHLIRSGLHIWKDRNCKKIIKKLRK